MNASKVNEELQEIYQPFLKHLYAQEWPEAANLSAPLLMHVFDEYMMVPRKIMFVGQETHGWGAMTNRSSMHDLLDMYQKFELGKKADYGYKIRYLTSPFWNFSRSLFYASNEGSPGISRRTNGFLWTNISKFDSSGTTPSSDLLNQNSKGFDLLRQEIAITKPDIVVFLTGRKYDERINTVFKNESESLLDNELLYLLQTADGSLPYLTFKTEHPRTLCQAKMYRPVLDKIVEFASKHQ